MQTEKLDLWALVELFGHTKICGRCTEQNIAGTNMLRVDVPETKKKPAFTRFFGSSAIYAINPIEEDAARLMADKLEVEPIQSYNIGELVKKHQQLLIERQAELDEKPDWMHDDDDDDDEIES